MNNVQNRTTAVYLRCSTPHQKVDAQRLAVRTWLKSAQIDQYDEFEDYAYSGGSTKRPALDRLMSGVKSGRYERIVVYSLSRFARSTKFLLEVADVLNDHKVALVSITESIDTKTPTGKCFFTILGAIAELEKEMIRGRVLTGLERAIAQGKTLGRRKQRDSEKIRSLRLSGYSYREIAEIAGCALGTVANEFRKSRTGNVQ